MVRVTRNNNIRKFIRHAIVNSIMLLSLWSGGAGLVYGQGITYGTIVGKVTDAQTGDLLPSVTITIANKSLGASTNFEGEFFIYGVPVGIYELRVASIGYTPVKVVQVQVSAGLETSVSIEIEPALPEMQKEIVVTASRNDVGRRTPGSIHILSEDELIKIFAESPGDHRIPTLHQWQ